MVSHFLAALAAYNLKPLGEIVKTFHFTHDNGVQQDFCEEITQQLRSTRYSCALQSSYVVALFLSNPCPDVSLIQMSKIMKMISSRMAVSLQFSWGVLLPSSLWCISPIIFHRKQNHRAKSFLLQLLQEWSVLVFKMSKLRLLILHPILYVFIIPNI